MPAASQVRAGAAYVEVFLKDNRLQRGLSAVSEKLRAFGAGVRQVGARVASLGVAAAAPFGQSARTFAGFEQQMARVRALTGAGDKDFRRLSAEAKRLGETTVFSASQAAEAMNFFALAGLDVEQILAAIGPTLDLAAAGQLEIGQAADITAKIMAGMGLSADDLGRAVDVLAKAMTTANTDLSQLGDAMKFVGPVAKSAGRDLEETVAVIQMLSNAGIQGEMAGTTLRGVLLSLTSPSKQAADELKRLGVEVLDARGDVRSLADIIDDMNNAMAGLGGGERLAVLGRIFDARQAAGFAELLSQGGDRLRGFTKTLGDSAGTAERISRIQLDTLAGDVTILGSAFEGLQIAVGEALGLTLRGAVQDISRLISGAARWARQNSELVAGVAAVAAGMVAAGAAIVVFGAVLSGLGTVIAAVGGAFALAGAAVGVFGSLLGFLLTPIGAVIAGTAALAAYLIEATGAGADALEWLGARFDGLKDTALRAWKGIGDALAAGDIALAARVLWLTLRMEWIRGVDFLEQQWLAFKGFFVEAFEQAVFAVARLIADSWAGLQEIWVEVVSFLSSAWTDFTSAILRAWNPIQEVIAKGMAVIAGLFDSDFDTEGVVRLIEQDSRRRDERIERERRSALAGSEQERRRRLAEIEQERQSIQGGLDRQQQRERTERERRTEQALEESRRDLADARSEWEDALAEAARARGEAEADAGAGRPDRPRAPAPPQPPAAPRLPEQDLGGLDEVIAETEAKLDVRGTFSAAAVRGLGSESLAERTAKGVEQVADNTKRLVTETAMARPVFT